MKQIHSAIINALEQYLDQHPHQRFGQALLNLYLMDFASEKQSTTVKTFLRDIHDDEDVNILSRMKKINHDKVNTRALELKLIKTIHKKDFQWLSRDYREGEVAYLHVNGKFGCLGKNGLYCKFEDEFPVTELPAGLLSIGYQNKSYTIFLTEQNNNKTDLYAKQSPFDQMALLTEIQEQKSTTNTPEESSILKVQILPSEITLSIIPLHTIKPLI